MPPSPSDAAVRWTKTSRGFKHYEHVHTRDGSEVLVYESSNAFEPRLWIGTDGDTVHVTLEEAAALRDAPDQDERLRQVLAVAIERHYQMPQPDPKEWKAGDPCNQCGSTDTGIDPVSDCAFCRGCGAQDDDE